MRNPSKGFQGSLASVRYAIVLSLFAGALVGIGQVAHAQSASDSPRDKGTSSRMIDAYRKLPLRFEPNQGQTDSQVDFISRGDGYTLFLTPTEAVFRLRSRAALQSSSPLDRTSDPRSRGGKDASQVVRMRLVGGNTQPAVAGIDKQAGVSNYLIGSDASEWRKDVGGYSKVLYREVYPSVDLVYYGNQRQLEYDFIVRPGGDPKVIRLNFEARSLRVDEDGSLVLDVAGGEVRQLAPVVYQDIAGDRRSVQGRYRILTGTTVGFEIGAYDDSHPLVIDPVLVYSTYLGGAGDDEAYAIVISGSGGTLSGMIVGGTMSNNFPMQSAYDSTNDGTMTGFVTKFNASGTLVFATYLGGRDWDRINSIALDSSGRAHVAGETCSDNFPTQAALQATYGGNCDMFVTKLNFAGSSLVYSTYVGGSQYDVASLIAMDTSSNYLVVGGTTGSSNFPLRNAFQSTRAGGLDGVALRIRDTGVLDYSTYIGGTGDDGVTAVAVSGGQPILTGYTASTNFPVTLPIQATNRGLWDAFVVKLSSTFVPQYSTYLGGGGYDFGAAIAIDSTQNIYVAGATGSTNFPTLTPFQAAKGGGTDAFVTKLNSSMALVYSTYLGGSGEDEAWGIAMTGTSNNAYVVGWTSSNNFPGATPLAYHGEYDGFVSRFNSAGSGLVWAEYLGGTDFDMITALTGDNTGLYLVGMTLSTDLPTQTPAQANNAGGVDAFVAVITSDAAGDLNSLMSEIQP